MNKEVELEIYLVVSTKKFGIYLFDKYELKNLYKDELVFNEKIATIWRIFGVEKEFTF